MLTFILFGSLVTASFLVALRSAARTDRPMWTRRLTILGVSAMGLAALQSIAGGGVLFDAPLWGALYLVLAGIAGDEPDAEHTAFGVLAVTGAILAIAALSLAPSDVVRALASGVEHEVRGAVSGAQFIPASDALLTLLTLAGVAAMRRVQRFGVAAPFVAILLLGAMYPDALRGLVPWANAVLATGLLLLWTTRGSRATHGRAPEHAQPNPA